MRLEEAPMLEDSLHELFPVGVITIKRFSKVRVDLTYTSGLGLQYRST